jgi:hypothetical protein
MFNSSVYVPFPDKMLKPYFVGRIIFEEHLYGDVSAGIPLYGKEHLPHASCSDALDYLELAYK